MEENALKAANFLKGIASQHRLVILCQLAEGEKSVTQLIEATSLPQTSMSQHLSKLKEENIVTFRRDHLIFYYSIKNEAIFKITDFIYHEFC